MDSFLTLYSSQGSLGRWLRYLHDYVQCVGNVRRPRRLRSRDIINDKLWNQLEASESQIVSAKLVVDLVGSFVPSAAGKSGSESPLCAFDGTLPLVLLCVCVLCAGDEEGEAEFGWLKDGDDATD